jgi:NAD(P)-dependent dehydrogenase (short-subunit alcohol dehydrogenase family)
MTGLGLTSTITSPALTGLILFALTLGPPPLRDALIRYFPSQLALSRTINALKGLFVVGLIGKANSALNRYALGQWQSGTAYRSSVSANKAGKGKWKWSEEVAVVTGGSSGIGSLLVKRLAEKGVTVAVIDVQPLSKDMEALPKVHYFNCDITNPEAVTATASEIRSTIGRAPSILVNNAGIANGDLIIDAPPSRVRKLFDVNVLSHYYLIQAFLPDMQKANKGHIMATASMASFVTMPRSVDYCASKAAVLAIYEGLRVEMRNLMKCPQICVSTVHPIWVRTPMIREVEGQLEKMGQEILTTGEVADAMAEQIFSGTGGQLLLPEKPLIRFVTGIRGWPNWLQELLRGRSERRL